MEDKELTDAQITVLSFCHDRLNKYVVQDIERLTREIHPRGPQYLAGCTVPLGLTLFAVSDLLGFLIRYDVDPRVCSDPERYWGATKNSRCFLSQERYFPPEVRRETGAIINVFRHGLVHQFFPKTWGITKIGPSNSLFVKSQTLISLNVNVLAELYLTAISIMVKDVEEGENRDLIIRMRDRLALIRKMNENVAASISLPTAGTITISTTTATTTTTTPG
jgi:hypothetical protein